MRTTPLTLLTALALAAPAQAACPDRIRTDGAWSAIKGPDGFAALAALANDPDRPERVFVSDGSRLARSLDGGCTWTTVLSLDPAGGATPAGAPRATILHLTVRGERVLAATDQTYSPTAALSGVPAVYVSADGGATFTRSTQGLPLTGQATRVALAPSNPLLAWVTVDAGDLQHGLVARSTDGGATWSEGPQLLGGAEADDASSQSPGSHGLAVDPLDPKSLWTTGRLTDGDSGLLHSTDGGATFATVPLAGLTNNRRAWSIDLEHRTGRPARLRVWAARYSDSGPVLIFSSEDGGATFTSDPPTGLNSSYRGWEATPGRLEDLLVTTGNGFNETEQGLFGYRPDQHTFFELDRAGFGVLWDGHADRAGYSFLSGEQPQTIARLALPGASVPADASPGAGQPQTPLGSPGSPSNPGSGEGSSTTPARSPGPVGTPGSQAHEPAGSAGFVHASVRTAPSGLLRVRLRGAGTQVRVALLRGRHRIATSRRVTVRAGRTTTLTLRLPARARRRGLSLRITGRDATGAARTSTAILRL